MEHSPTPREIAAAKRYARRYSPASDTLTILRASTIQGWAEVAEYFGKTRVSLRERIKQNRLMRA